MRHQVLVIGGGSAGYAAARTAREAGAEVAIVDHGPLGGLCILRGCMPTKAMLRSSDVLSLMRRAREFGLLPVEPRADLAAILARKDRLIREFAEYRIGQLRDPGITLYEERARFRSPEEIQVGDRVVRAEKVIIATGSVIHHVPIPGLEEVGYITSDEALALDELPHSLLVLGGGPVAVELAQFFQRLGTRVTLIQRSSHILSRDDADLAEPVEARFRSEGMEVFTGTQLHRFTREGDTRVAHFAHEGREKTAAAELVLQALGRRPNIDGLGLEEAGVQVERGRIRVDEQMRTSQPHIYAAGDVTGLEEIVHLAIQQAEIAAHNAVHPEGPAQCRDDRLVVRVVFTDPQVASVGLGENECQEKGAAHLVASYPFADHGKALCLGETHGHVKLLCRPDTGELIGGQIVGPEAAELIHELVAVMYFRGTVRDLVQMPHYHPTLAEILTYPAEELAARTVADRAAPPARSGLVGAVAADQEPLRRTAARALLVTPSGEVLLMCAEDPGDGHRVWFAPGGGLQPGEGDRDGLQRELFEETGQTGLEIGPQVWTRFHAFTWAGGLVHQHERFYLVPTPRFDPSMRTNPAETELLAFREYRWWTAEQIDAADEVFAPRRLAVLLCALLRHGPPAAPIDAGV